MHFRSLFARSTLLAFTAVCFAAAGQVKPDAKTAAVPADAYSWKPVKVSALDIARNADKMIGGLAGVQATTDYRLEIPSGNAYGTVVSRILNSKVFDLKYPVVYNDPKIGVIIAVAHAVSDGKTVTFTTRRQVASRAVGKKVPPPARAVLVENWPKLGGREVFSGFLDQRKPFEDYVNGLLDKKEGYTVRVFERKIPFQGTVFDQYLIRADRSASGAKKLGPSAVYLIFDARIHLPVNLRATVQPVGQKHPLLFTWTTAWKNNQKFDRRTFKP